MTSTLERQELRVNELITTMKEWNHGILRSIISEEVVARICKIPLTRHETEDQVEWPWHDTGLSIFLVRSAYEKISYLWEVVTSEPLRAWL